jgi:hypothetical protein
MEGTPVNTRAGNVRNDPPPATEFMRPAPSAEPMRSKYAAIRHQYDTVSKTVAIMTGGLESLPR